MLRFLWRKTIFYFCSSNRWKLYEGDLVKCLMICNFVIAITDFMWWFPLAINPYSLTLPFYMCITLSGEIFVNVFLWSISIYFFLFSILVSCFYNLLLMDVAILVLINFCYVPFWSYYTFHVYLLKECFYFVLKGAYF